MSGGLPPFPPPIPPIVPTPPSDSPYLGPNGILANDVKTLYKDLQDRYWLNEWSGSAGENAPVPSDLAQLMTDVKNSPIAQEPFVYNANNQSNNTSFFLTMEFAFGEIPTGKELPQSNPPYTIEDAICGGPNNSGPNQSLNGFIHWAFKIWMSGEPDPKVDPALANAIQDLLNKNLQTLGNILGVNVQQS